ncbi:MAG: hypothetical protein E7459_01185 [Ruminococcaceae bacterium]|nr:hypothetical protein [Oscillospiraceae bacterium]
MKKNLRILAMLLCVTMLITVMSPAMATGVRVDSDNATTVTIDDVDNVVEFTGGQWEKTSLKETEAEVLGEDTFPGKDEIVTVIVVLEDEPLLKVAQTMGSDVPNLLTTSAGAKLEQSLLASHSAVHSEIMALCADLETSAKRHDYTAVLNGFSMDMPYGMIDDAEALPGIKRITPVNYYNVPENMSSFDLAMENSNGMIGADKVFMDMSFSGHDGAGAVVAILDTGLDTDHEAFMVMPETVRYTQSDVQKMMNDIKLSSGITNAADTYVNAKVPYAYDYANDDCDVNGDIDHGVHVAGTIAGNNGEDFFGVAPNAQLMIMKVFADGSGSGNGADITAGLDDAVKLGADSINMSLGSAAGFVFTRATEEEVYNNCYDAGINLLVAAGNDTSTSYMNQYGNGLAQAESLDNSIVGSPSTGYGAMSVASVQNVAAPSNYFLLGDMAEDNKIGFSLMVYAPSSTQVDFFTQVRTWNENTFTREYVVIPGIGEESDYAGLDVTDKIALVRRGVTNFEDKAAIAKSHGAKAVIIYNNVDEAIAPAYNTFTLPMVGISLSDGEKLIAAAETGNNTVTFGPANANNYFYQTPVEERIPWTAILPASDGGRVSSFSSIGPGTDLSLKPEISAPGGNIMSSVIGGGYAVMSGTSMATPHMAGVAAVVRNYVRNELGVTDANQLRDITDALMMSTTVPAVNSTGVEYSPRWQGAGIVNVKNAVTAQSYLTVEKIDDSNPDEVLTLTRPKAELGWNDAGKYTFTFKVHNISDQSATYTLSAVSLTESVVNQYGVDFSDGVATRLGEEDFTMTFDCGNVLTVAAGKTATVKATLTLTDTYKTELFEHFENGNYVEGFVYLQPAEGVTLVLPYLGFCGNWLDAGTVFEGAPDTAWQLQPTLFATVNVVGSGYYLAEDAYTNTYNFQRLAFSPKIAGDQQYLGTILTTRRNLTDFAMTVSNAEGEAIWALGTSHLTKSYFYAGYGAVINTQVLAEGWNGRYYNEETGAFDGEYVPSGQYYFTFSGDVGQHEDGYTEVTYPLWVDSGAPEITNVQTYKDTDGKFKLSFDVQDDHYVRIVNIIDSTNTWLLTYTIEDFASLEPQGSKSRVVMDLDELCQFLADNGLNPGTVKLQAGDYALNNGYVYVDLGPEYMSLSNMTIARGDSQEASLRILPAEKADSFELTWTSDDESVATVDQNGLVTGVNHGTTTIKVIANSGLSAEAVVTIGDETLPPEEPETPNPNAHVDYPSPEVTDKPWDTRVEASDSEVLNDRFEADGLWYKVTGADTVQLIKNPNVANDYSATYPQAPAELVIPETVSHEGKDYTVTSIGYRAFYLSSQITGITLPETIRVIGDYAFQLAWSNSKLTSINLPEGLEEIGANAFYGNSNCDFVLPSSLRYIGYQAFAFSGITEVKLGEAMEDVGDRAFSYCYKLTKAELSVVAQDSEGLFMYSNTLKDVTIQDGVERIPENCFYYCPVETIEYPDSVKELRKAAFYGTGLKDLCLEGTNITTIGDFAFAGVDNCYDFVIPDSVTYVGSDVFYWCRYLRSIHFGENVAYVGDGTMSSYFLHPDVTAAHVEVDSATAGAAVRRSGFLGVIYKDGVKFDVYTGAPFTIDGLTYTPISADEVMVTAVEDGTVGVIVIPETVTCEGDNATYTVTAVGDRLFSQKYYITEIHLPDTITTVGERAFDQIHGLEYINIPKNLTTISGLQPFGYGGWNTLEWSGVWNPETLVVPGSLKTWNSSAFPGNHYTAIVVEEGVDHIGEYGFASNKKVQSVQLPGTLRAIETQGMANMESLKELTLPEGLEYLGDMALSGVALESLSLPDSLQYIGYRAFYSYFTDYNTPYPYEMTYTGIPEVTIPGGLVGLGWEAFEGCVEITTTLGSQRNLIVERCNMDAGNLPTVIWDGRTDIPAGDYSVIPEGMTVTMEEGTVIEGTLYVEGTLIYACTIEPGDGLVVTGEAIRQHGEFELRNIQGATCGTDGYSGDVCCVECNEVMSAGQVIPATGEHNNTEVRNAQAATCIAEGYTGDTYCLDCGLLVREGQTVSVDGDNHVHTEVRNAYDATCTNDGYTGDTYCLDCEKLVVSGEVVPAVCPSNSFTDVPKGQWYHEAVDFVVGANLMHGISETSFAPNATTSRAMVVTTLYRMAGSPEVNGENNFTDLTQDWYAAAVQWAVETGVTTGYSETIFAPNAPITREQLATMLYRYAKACGMDVSAQADLSGYTDAGKISSWALTAMAWANAEGIIQGDSETTLSPRATSTRAQLAMVLTRICQE